MAAFTGLLTGAGAANGLEVLLARMRAEEALANQGRALDIDEFEANSMDRYRTGQLSNASNTLGENQRQFDAEAPNREATARSLLAGANVNQAEAGLKEEQLGFLKGLRPIIGPGVEPGAAGGGPAASNLGSDVSGLNTPLGRIRLDAAGLNPSAAFGPVNVSNAGDEQLMDAYYEKLNGMAPGTGTGLGNRLTFDQRLEALKQKPNTMIAQGGLDLRRTAAGERTEMHKLRVRLAEQQLNQGVTDPLRRQMALAEFRNRIQNDIQQPTWMTWLSGQDVPDPGAQIETIATDIITKYSQQGPTGASNSAPPGGSATPPPAPRRRFDRFGNPVQ